MLRLLPVLLVLALVAAGCEVRSGNVDIGVEVETAGEEPASDSARGDGARAEPALALRLPTSNDALFRGDEGAFYQALDRTIPGLRPHGWEGGRYGFVRSPAKTRAGLVFTQLHEGLDIRPLHRDAQGEPLDTVRAAAAGTVAYVHREADVSSYGRYVVVRHRWDGAPVYTLYAHLDTVAVDPGAGVPMGAPLGRMGWTGRGTAQHRAHVHFEVGLLLNRHFQRWFDAYYGTTNHHGLYFGRNLAGVDPAALYEALRAEPGLTFRRFVRRQPVAYRLALPGERPLDLLTRYPWLADDGATASDTARAGAWVLGFTREGVPVEVGRRPEPVAGPEVVYVGPEIRQGLSTGGLMIREGEAYRLTREGRAYAALLMTTADGVPPWF